MLLRCISRENYCINVAGMLLRNKQKIVKKEIRNFIIKKLETEKIAFKSSISCESGCIFHDSSAGGVLLTETKKIVRYWIKNFVI